MYTAYSSSKTALNVITVYYAAVPKHTPIKISRLCPGHCATAVNNLKGSKDPSAGAKIAVTLALLPSDGATGGFLMIGLPHGNQQLARKWLLAVMCWL